jgi:AICAR transformylase/IMP cyclohydrolase PurH
MLKIFFSFSEYHRCRERAKKYNASISNEITKVAENIIKCNYREQPKKEGKRINNFARMRYGNNANKVGQVLFNMTAAAAALVLFAK